MFKDPQRIHNYKTSNIESTQDQRVATLIAPDASRTPIVDMPSYQISSPAYLKIVLHCAKHPHRSVNGLLIGRSGSAGQVDILDSVPLLHNWTSLSPMMEIGLDLVRSISDSA